MSRLCLIPAKGSSTRLPRKNLREIDGVPLIGIAIKKAIAVRLFDLIVVSTEDETIASVARSFGAYVPFLRETDLAVDPATVVDVAIDVITKLSTMNLTFDSLFITLPTTPLVSLGDLQEAVAIFDSANGATVMSVCACEFPPFNSFLMDEGELRPCFPDSNYTFVKSTECPETFRSNGAIIGCNIENFLHHRSYRRGKLLPHIMPPERSIDIDTEFELEVAKLLYKARKSDRNC